ncbi:hypothetical protein VULLAG_LOCUS19035 [Vulpes lagopus]
MPRQEQRREGFGSWELEVALRGAWPSPQRPARGQRAGPATSLVAFPGTTEPPEQGKDAQSSSLPPPDYDELLKPRAVPCGPACSTGPG